MPDYETRASLKAEIEAEEQRERDERRQQAALEAEQLERIERLTPLRWGFLALAAFLVVSSVTPWALSIRKQGKQRWKETLAYEQYQRDKNSRDMIVGHILANHPNPDMVTDEQLARMGLAPKTDMGPPPPKPREISYGPPWSSTVMLLLALSSAFGSFAIRQRQVQEIQVVHDAQVQGRARHAELRDVLERKKAQLEALEGGAQPSQSDAPATQV